MEIYIVFSKEEVGGRCSIFIEGVYESEKEAKHAADMRDGWVVIRKLIRKSA